MSLDKIPVDYYQHISTAFGFEKKKTLKKRKKKRILLKATDHYQINDTNKMVQGLIQVQL